MSLGKELISKEIGRLKRGVTYAKKAITSTKEQASITGWQKTIDLHGQSIVELEKDLKKL